MKSSKKYVFILIALCVTALVSGIIFLVKIAPTADKNTVTRYEWLQMLGEQFGINGYMDESPYFRDVDSDNPYFSYVQSAVEWEVIDTASKFNGDDYATGEFIALTAMKTIGESKFILCFDTMDTITDDTYIDFAIEYGLIEEEKLKKGFSGEECAQVLENLKSIYFGELWKDDYSDVTYQDSVIELSPKEVLQSNADCSEIAVTDSMLNYLEVGDIIVFEQENTKIKYAREITGIGPDGTLSLSTTELDKVIVSLTESDITELTFDDIVNYYGLDENVNAVNNLRYRQIDAGFINTRVFSNENSKGFKIYISTESEDKERHIVIKITDKFTGISYVIPISNQVESDDEYNAEIDIDRIYIGGQIDYSVLGGLKYAEAAVDVQAKIKSEIKSEEEKKIRLLKTSIPLANGIAQADIELYIVLSVDGSISFEAELPIEVSASYEKNRGLRNFESNFSAEEQSINANCNASAVLRIEPTLVVLGCLNVMDMEADIGVAASAEIATHSNAQICVDISVSFPVCTVSICGDDDKDTIIGDLGLSAEWEIISSENAPIKFDLHCEILADATTQFVEKCTYKDSGEDKETDGDQETGGDKEVDGEEIDKPDVEKAVQMDNTYYTRYKEVTGIDRPVFCFDYPDGWKITMEEVPHNDESLYYDEFVGLENDRGVWIKYMQYNTVPGSVGSGSAFHYIAEYEVERVGESSLKLTHISDSDELVVAKIRELGVTDSEGVYYDYDEDAVSYAVLLSENVGSQTISWPEYSDMCSFYYPEMGSFQIELPDGSYTYIYPYVFYADAPDGEFTEEEEKEVIAILSSFREAR